ncbi:hypothetical protein TrRE_jg13141, partial [Triparma retinervis]
MSELTSEAPPAAPAAPAPTSLTPSTYLKSILGRPILVRLHTGVTYRGILACLDGYMNIAMEQTEEYGITGELESRYGD